MVGINSSIYELGEHVFAQLDRLTDRLTISSSGTYGELLLVFSSV